MNHSKLFGRISPQKSAIRVLLCFLIACSCFTSLYGQNTPYRDVMGNPSLGTPDMGYPKGTGLSTFNTNSGFHTRMVPLKDQEKKPVDLSVSKQTRDSMLKNEMRMLRPLQAELLTKQDLKALADSILNEGLDLYKLIKVSGMSDELLKGAFPNFESLSYFDRDSIKTVFCQHDGSGYRVKAIFDFSRNDSLKPGSIRISRVDRPINAKEKRLMDIRKEIRELIQESPNLNASSKLIHFDIAELDKNNLLYFYLLPRALEPNLYYIGGDYIFRYSLTNQLISIEPQHSSLMPVELLKGADKAENNHTNHTHGEAVRIF